MYNGKTISSNPTLKLSWSGGSIIVTLDLQEITAAIYMEHQKLQTRL